MPLDEVFFDDDDDEEEDDVAHVGATLIVRSDERTSQMSLTKLLSGGVRAVLADLEQPSQAADPEACKSMADYAHQAFADKKPVVLSLTLLPEGYEPDDAADDEDDDDDAVPEKDTRLLH